MTFAVRRPSRDASSRFVPAVGGSVECASGSTGIIVRGELRAGLEVCLEVHDFLRVLVIPNSERSLKTKASRRRVPVHPELLRLGFTRDALPFAGSATMWSQKLNRWLRSAGFADARLVVHSFRHTVKDRLRAARVPEAEQRALLGHAGQGVADSYGNGFPLSVLKKTR